MVYMDNSATTMVKPKVFNALEPYLKSEYGNPSSIYSIGRNARRVVDAARQTVANAIGCKPNELFFTASGSESDNWAIKGVAYANAGKGKHIITSSVEHHAVLHTMQYLEKHGYEVTYLPVDEYGVVNPEQVENAIKSTTILISIMYANNEVGTIQPIQEIGAIAKKHKVIFHTDAVQAMGHVPVNVDDLNVDLLSLSAHKIYGPKGVGALYIRRGTKIHNLIQGGGQENNRRAGTENVAGIVGFAKAAELAVSGIDKSFDRLKKMRDRLISGILDTIPHCRLNGHPTQRLCNNVNISFEFIEGESLLLMLDMKGICASSGSACTSGSLDPSHVLLAMGLKHEIAHGSLRLSLGDFNTESDIDYVLEALPPVVARLREMSPLYEEIEKGIKHV